MWHNLTYFLAQRDFIQYWEKALAFLLPCNCLLCAALQEQLICASCQSQFFDLTLRRCDVCALPLPDHDRVCGSCLTHPPAFDRSIVACDYLPPLDQLLRNLKFGHQLAVAPMLAQRLAMAADSLPDLPDLLIPVPLSRQRLAARGFNQALEITRPLAKRLARPCFSQLLLRVRDTEQQTRLHPNQRQHNIRHAFSPNPRDADKIPGRHIGVVDDVMTTGATMNEVAACLKRHGAARVTNLVFARTLPP